MRTADQLADISERAKTGFCALQQTLPDIRMQEMLVNEENTFSKLFRCMILTNVLDFGVSLTNKNRAADQLVREGVIAKAAMNTNYFQEGYCDDYVQ